MTQTEHTIEAELRNEIGSPACRRMRGAGRVPAIIYGGPGEPVRVSVDMKVATKLVHSPSIALLQISADDSRHVLVQDTQWDHLKGRLLHIDFREIRMDQKIQTTVPLITSGEPAGSSEGGVLDQAVHELFIECLPTSLPEKIEVDVSSMHVGDLLLLSQLDLPEGVVAVSDDPEMLLASVHAPRVEAESDDTEGAEDDADSNADKDDAEAESKNPPKE